MFFRFSLLTLLLACSTQAIQVKSSYGPPPQQRLPHREYGVPQQMPFREYGPPALKYGPPKLNFIGGPSSGLHEQIKNHYGAPKPFYGPPHRPQQQYGPPAQQYGPPPQQQYGPPPPLKIQHKPAPAYGPPKPQYGPPPPPQALPLFQPGPQFKPPQHQPATSYGPPPSGPLNVPPKQIYGPPPPNYGPPPLPNFNNGPPQTTVIVTGAQQGHHQHQQQQHHHQKQEQVQIQIDASGHTHSISGSQAPFHTACDGWKPIPAPVGAYVENNNIETQSGYSNVAQGVAHSSGSSFSNTQYSAGSGIGSGPGVSAIGGTGSGSTILVDGSGAGGNALTDEQLVAVALQSGGFDGNTIIKQEVLPPTGPSGDFNQHGLNSLEADALQLSLGAIDDSYNKPPADSFAPGSKYEHKFNHQSSSHGSGFAISGPGGNYGPPPPPQGNYGPPPQGNYGPPPPAPSGNFELPPPPKGNYGPPPSAPSGNYGPPPPPSGNYGPPPPSGNYGPPSGPAAAFVHHHAQAGLGIQYGKQSGNVGPFPPRGGAPPSKPVAFRPPVPQGLFESIGATVQHLDQFGVKPQQQALTYIPPAANEIAQTGPGNLNNEYGPPAQQQQVPQVVLEQQLPQQQPAQVFVQIEQQQQQHHQQQQQQQQFQNAHAEYGVPPPPPPQQIPPQPQYLPPPPPAQLQQQYLPPSGPPQQQYLPPSGHAQQFNGGASYSSSASASFDSSAYAATQYNTVHAQALPLQQQQPRFHDCGHGPNLVGGGFNYQQQQQQQQYSSGSSTSIAQSIPLAEQHSQFVSGPDSSYGPPPSGGNEIDHIGYASEKSQVTALPDGTNPEGLPGLDGLNVLSAQKSEAIHLSSQEGQKTQTYDVNFAGQQSSNHEEILSADLLQTILNAVEQPQQQHQPLPANHKAESRSDIDIHDEPIEAEDENEPGVEPQESKHSEVKVLPKEEKVQETDTEVKEIEPIVVKEED